MSPQGLFPRLLFQLVPAIVVSAAGIALLSGLAAPTSPVTSAAAIDTAITTEAVFTPTPKAPEPEQKTTTAARAKSKPAAPNGARPHKFASESAQRPEVAAEPLPIVPIAEQPQAAASDPVYGTVVNKLRGATASVQALPQRAYSKMASWFSANEPPRPPAEVPDRLNADM